MSIKLPIPGPKLREEAIRAAQARHDQLTAGLDKKWWAGAAAKLEQLDKRLTAEGR